MTTTILTLLLFLLSLMIPQIQPKPISSPYLSPKTLFPNYQKMLTSFKIYTYPPPPNQEDSIFYKALLTSKFLTQNPNQAHLFFIPFSPDLPTRSIARLIRDLRSTLPFWNRTLGADHVFFSRVGIVSTSDRNIVELNKNSIQISNFPSTNFIPHKDITLPPLTPTVTQSPNKTTSSATFLGHMRITKTDLTTEFTKFVNELNDDPDFLIESQPFDDVKSKFCIFMYNQDVSGIGEAMGRGCVPVVITGRPIQDLPLMDVIKWEDVAVFSGTRGGVTGVKRLLGGISEDRYVEMRGFGIEVCKHMVWNGDGGENMDGFHMIMYQLWLRRHTIRYARREWDESM